MDRQQGGDGRLTCLACTVEQQASRRAFQHLRLPGVQASGPTCSARVSRSSGGGPSCVRRACTNCWNWATASRFCASGNPRIRSIICPTRAAAHRCLAASSTAASRSSGESDSSSPKTWRGSTSTDSRSRHPQRSGKLALQVGHRRLPVLAHVLLDHRHSAHFGIALGLLNRISKLTVATPLGLATLLEPAIERPLRDARILRGKPGYSCPLGWPRRSALVPRPSAWSWDLCYVAPWTRL